MNVGRRWMAVGARLGIATSVWAAEASPMCPLGANWVLVPEFSDEFDGTSLDTNRWWDFNLSWHGVRPGFFSRENVVVTNGGLHRIARTLRPEEVSIENRVRGFDRFTTATVKSTRRIRHGYFEARCKAMRANVCNAFWLYDPLDPPAKYREGDFSEEIDIFEVFGKTRQAGT